MPQRLLCKHFRKAAEERQVFPQTIDVIRTRMEPRGIEVQVGNWQEAAVQPQDGVVYIQTTGETLTAAKVVIAAGAFSHRIAARLGETRFSAQMLRK